MGFGGRGEEGAAQPALGPPCCVYSDMVSACLERGRRSEDISATRPETSHPQVRPGPLPRQEQWQFSTTGFLNHGPRDSVICEREEGPIPALKEETPLSTHHVVPRAEGPGEGREAERREPRGMRW